MQGSLRPARALACAFFALWLALMLVPFTVPALGPVAGRYQYVVLALFALAHGTWRHGAWPMLRFAVIVIVVAGLSESLSIHTGLPFGWFAHQPSLGTRIIDVPILVGVGWLAIGYISIAIAGIILGELPARSWPGGVLPVAAAAAFVGAGWNAAIAPLGATLQKSWLYRDGGGY